MSQTLKLYIPKVLSENKVVLLKGIGTLRINYRSAVINHDLSVITAPREEIYFVPAEEQKIDPVLVKIVELIAQVDHEEATDLVYSFMNDLQLELRSTGSVSFPSIGWIKQDRWGSMFFEPASEYIALNRYFGFSQVRLPEALTQAEQEVLADLRETVHEGAVTRPISRSEPKRRWGFIISSILMIAFVLTYFLVGNDKNRPSNTQLEDKPIVEKGDQNLISPKEGTLSGTPEQEVADMPRFKDPGPNFLPVFRDLETLIDFTEEDAKSCVIIVGAFSQPGNVTKMINRIHGSSYESVVIPGPELTKVGLRILCDDNQQNTLDWAKREFDQSAWIYTKPL